MLDSITVTRSKEELLTVPEYSKQFRQGVEFVQMPCNEADYKIHDCPVCKLHLVFARAIGADVWMSHDIPHGWHVVGICPKNANYEDKL